MQNKENNKQLKCQCSMLGELGCSPSRYDKKKELPFVNHVPGQCRCKNDIRWYRRDGKKLLLCSICCLIGDIPIESKLKGEQ